MITITFDENWDVSSLPEILSEHDKLPFSSSPLYFAGIVEAQRLTDEDCMPRVYKLTLDLKNIENDSFLPGDTIGILPQNDENVVEDLIQHLHIEAIANVPCKITSSEKNALKKFSHILTSQVTTIRNILQYKTDLRMPPRKDLLKCIQQYSKNTAEIVDLNNALTSSEAYYNLLNSPVCRNLLTLLQNVAPSSQPPIERLLQYLPALKPRAYSISSAFQQDNNTTTQLDLTISVLETNVELEKITGLCSGWLEKLMINSQIDENIPKIPFYFRNRSKFHLQYGTEPMILIATGAGIAPFRSFLQYQKSIDKTNCTIWLIYGCRTIGCCLYQKEIEDFHRSGVLKKRNFCYSKESENGYVQDCILEHSKEIMTFISKEHCTIYLCGNHNKMVKDVQNTFIQLFMSNLDLDIEQAECYLNELKKQERFLIDIWI